MLAVMKLVVVLEIMRVEMTEKTGELPESIRALMVSEEASILFGDERTHKTEAAIEALLMQAYTAGWSDLEDARRGDYYRCCPCGCGDEVL